MLTEKRTHWFNRLQSNLRLMTLRWWLIGIAVVLLATVSVLVTNPNAGGFGGHAVSEATASSAAPASAPMLGTNAGIGTYSAIQQAGTTTTTNGTSQASAKDSAAITGAAQRFVIQTAMLTLTVHDLNATTNQLSQLAVADGGFVQSMQQTTNTAQAAVNMTLRIPQSDFETVLHATKGLGQVTSFSQSGQDVTQQHNNMQAQISQLQSEAQAYTRLFSKASTMADMLQIQQSLVQVNNQIADLNSQLHDLNRSVQFATINLVLTTTASPITQPPTPFLGSLAQSLHFMKQSALALMTLIAWVLPWGVLATVVIAVSRWWLRRKAKGSVRH